MKKDVVIIGGGPGGYVAGIRLGQLGKSVAVIDKGNVGGVCLNWGCIPSKALIHAAKVYEEIRHGETIGISVKGASIDLKKTQAWKNDVVKKLTSGVSQLLKASGGQIIKGEARFTGANKITVKKDAGEETIEFQQAIVATGSRPISIPGFEMDGKKVVDSKDALDWTKAPKSMVVIGGGVIGMEMGMLYEKLGTKVTVVEMTDQLLPGTDKEVAQTLQRVCKKRSIDVYVSSKALSYEEKKGTLNVKLETQKGSVDVPCEVILLSVGRAPNGGDLGLGKYGVKVTDRGMIPVNGKMQTNVPHIYAIGDVSGPPLLAHKASKEGLVAAEVIAGGHEEYDVRAMPGAIFTDPEIATVGLNEEEAKAKGLKVYTGKFPFAASGRALSSEQTDGFAKLVIEEGTDLLVGASIIGAGASDLISEVTFGIEMGASVEDMAMTVHPHPTMSETLMEAAEAALGKPIHTVARKSSPKRERKHG